MIAEHLRQDSVPVRQMNQKEAVSYSMKDNLSYLVDKRQ